MMLILLTGADGFIGRNIKRHLEASGHNLFSTVFFDTPGVDQIRLDLKNPSAFARLPEIAFDAVIHTAGSIDQGLPSKELFAINAAGTKGMAEWARQRGVKHFIHLSSVSVYGLRTLGQDRREDNTKRYDGIFALPYMRSKALAEKWIVESNIPYSALRLPPVFGRNDSYFSDAVLSPLKKGKFSFCGTGEKLVSLLSIESLVRIIEMILKKGPLNDCFNACDLHIPWNKIVMEYAKAAGLPKPQGKKTLFSIIPRLGDEKFLLMITFSAFGAHYPSDKLNEAIGFVPSQTFENAVNRAIGHCSSV